MKTILGSISILCLLLACTAEKAEKEPAVNTGAISHVADTATYYVGLIKSVPDREQISDERVQEIQAAHLANIRRLAGLELMALAGPFWTDDNTNVIRGLFFYHTESEHQADTLAATDPAVINNRLEVENFPWIGSANMAYDTLEGAEGMRNYFATIFWHGGEDDLPTYMELYRQQSEAVSALCDTGRVVLAGPFTDCERGGMPYAMFIYSADSLSTIEKAVADAPGIANGSLDALTINWYGPVGLRE